METQSKKLRALALMSGGLDSTLAARIVADQGVEVTGLHLLSPFGCKDDVQASADMAGVPLIFREKGEAYIDMVENPRYGYGKNMNPCIDCRIFMFQLADVVRQDKGYDFVVTGEVLGQRPMSQNRQAMGLIDSKSPLKIFLFAPSAQHMEPTLPEREGWLDREKLLGITGRSRHEQIALAKKLGITEFKNPGGGCLLTEAAFSARLRDWFGNTTYKDSTERMAQGQLMRLGRHFRVSDLFKVIVSRDEKENTEIAKWVKDSGGTLFFPANFLGPCAVAFGDIGPDEQQMVGAMISRYGKSSAEPKVGFERLESTGEFPVSRQVTDEELNAIRL